MSDEPNLYKAAVALKYMRDGLAPFVSIQTRRRHQNHLQELGVVVGTQRTCSLCTKDNLLPDHFGQGCRLKFSKTLCFCKRPKGRRKCPHGICSKLYDLIISDHILSDPDWSNTDPQKWCSDYWEYAKCFIDSPANKDVHSIGECDITALLNICCNNCAIRHVIDNPGNFEQCRAVHNQILHSESRITDKQLCGYIDQMTAALTDKSLTGDSDAAHAVKSLKKIKTRGTVGSKYKSGNVKVLEDIERRTSEVLKSKTMEILDRETQTLKSSNEKRTTPNLDKLEKDTDQLIEEIGLRLIQQAKQQMGPKADTPNLRKSVEMLIDDITDREMHADSTGVASSGEEEYDSNMRETTRLFRDLLGQNLLKPDAELFSDSGLTESIATMDDNYMDISRDLDDARSFTEDVTFPLQKEVFSTYRDVDAEDNIEKSKGLGEEYLLDNIELNKLCTSEGRTSPNVKKECDKICTAIKTKSEKIVHVVPAYKTNDETKIIFVVFAQSEITLETRWKLEVRIVYQYSDESKCAMYCANNNPLSTESSRKIGKIIDKYSMELMHNHTYLSVISASPVVSKHYGTSNYKTESVSCIALYVIVKHFIPINEEPFPQMLDGIPVDVREGGVQFCGASAEDFHDQVRMGCKITSTFQPQKHGTLGGFVEHPDYGLCGITCAHVVLNDKWKFALKEKMKVKEKEMEPCALFQPSYDHDDTQEQNQIGRLVEVTYKEGGNGKPGIDLALFKIDKRPPSEGTFPDIQGTTTRIRYDSGKVWGKEGVPPNQPQVQKFGFVTGLTYGEIQFDNGVVREKPFHSEMELETTKYTTTLYNQYLIKSNDVNVQFSKLGDSGALVFMKDNTGEENDLRCIGMVVGVLNDNLCAVTPITAILEELKVTTLKSFVPTWGQIEGRLREMEERLENVITRTVNVAVTNALASRQNPS